MVLRRRIERDVQDDSWRGRKIYVQFLHRVGWDRLGNDKTRLS